MQVTETLSDGLKREFRVVVPANDLDSKVSTRLGELKDTVRINGFRPGKVPVGHLKRMYGRSVMAEAIEATVRDANAQIVTEHGFRLAMEPQVKLPTEEAAINAVFDGKSDLDYSVTMEVLPKIELSDFKDIKIDRLTAEVAESEIDEAIGRIVDQNRPFAPKGEGAEAANGDKVTISFKGTIDGVPFEGGAGEDIPVELGSKSFIPGFEEQLVGVKIGETRTVKTPFPENYLKAELAGKNAEFEVTAKAIDAPGEVTADDAFAKQLGLESIAKLRDAVKDRITREACRRKPYKLKRQLRRALIESHKVRFAPTPSTGNSTMFQTVKRSEAGPHFRQGNHRGSGKASIARSRRGGSALSSPRSQAADQGHRRGSAARCGRARAPVPRAGAAGLGLLPQQCERAREPAGADLRGKGRRLPGRARQGDREEGRARRALQAG